MQFLDTEQQLNGGEGIRFIAHWLCRFENWGDGFGLSGGKFGIGLGRGGALERGVG